MREREKNTTKTKLSVNFRSLSRVLSALYIHQLIATRITFVFLMRYMMSHCFRGECYSAQHSRSYILIRTFNLASKHCIRIKYLWPTECSYSLSLSLSPWKMNYLFSRERWDVSCSFGIYIYSQTYNLTLETMRINCLRKKETEKNEPTDTKNKLDHYACKCGFRRCFST